ncbi:MAG: hypothetical protein AAF804_21330, partial [Bacteroidota bacterium]
QISSDQKRAAKYLFQEGRRYSKAWDLVEIYDPYQGGIKIIQADKAKEQLIFFQDGDFIRFDAFNYSEGKWELSEDRKQLRLDYRMLNNQLYSTDQRQLFSFDLLIHQSDSMVLGIMGRHGQLEYRYQARPLNP